MTWSAAMGLPARLAMLLCLLSVEAELNKLTAVDSGINEESFNADPPSMTENASHVSGEDQKDFFTSMWEWLVGGGLWEWLSGQAGQKEAHGTGDRSFEGTAAGVAGAAGPLASFCGLEPGASQAVDCSCCADHLTSSPLQAAALLYGGGASAEAPAYHRDVPGHSPLNGLVRIWSLGRWIPSVWCDRGQPICRCEDRPQGWRVSEPACRAAGACLPPAGPEELSSTPINDSLPAPPPGTAGCASDSSSPRKPIGSARCEDMSVRQCAEFYARGKDGWHYCKVDSEAVRTCSAKLSGDLAERKKEDTQMDLWIVQQAYTPDLNWTVAESQDRTERVAGEPLPPADEVRAMLGSWGMPPQRKIA